MKRWFSFLSVLMLLTLAACSPKPAAAAFPEAESAGEAASVPESEAAEAPAFFFSTVDSDGDPVDETILEGHSLIMINMWEPWCGPCVREMPDLQRLYESYADRGLLIIGVYSSEEGAAEVLKSNRVSYPTILYTDAFAGFATAYVPTTVFLDEQGNLIAGPYVGANELEGWAKLIEDLL